MPPGVGAPPYGGLQASGSVLPCTWPESESPCSIALEVLQPAVLRPNGVAQAPELGLPRLPEPLKSGLLLQLLVLQVLLDARL
eukprot:4241067-Alexandrium_andersonii.AAC.1